MGQYPKAFLKKRCKGTLFCKISKELLEIYLAISKK
jgi:hypothetical protein